MTKRMLTNSPDHKLRTIFVCEDDPLWNEAFQRYLSDTSPTDDSDWKQGIYLLEVAA